MTVYFTLISPHNNWTWRKINLSKCKPHTLTNIGIKPSEQDNQIRRQQCCWIRWLAWGVNKASNFGKSFQDNAVCTRSFMCSERNIATLLTCSALTASHSVLVGHEGRALRLPHCERLLLRVCRAPKLFRHRFRNHLWVGVKKIRDYDIYDHACK